MKISRNGTTRMTAEELFDAMKIYQKAWVPDPSRGRPESKDEEFIMRAPGPLVLKSELDVLATRNKELEALVKQYEADAYRRLHSQASESSVTTSDRGAAK